MDYIRIKEGSEGWFVVHADYDESLVSNLRRVVDTKSRHYLGKNHWTFHPKYKEQVMISLRADATRLDLVVVDEYTQTPEEIATALVLHRRRITERNTNAFLEIIDSIPQYAFRVFSAMYYGIDLEIMMPWLLDNLYDSMTRHAKATYVTGLNKNRRFVVERDSRIIKLLCEREDCPNFKSLELIRIQQLDNGAVKFLDAAGELYIGFKHGLFKRLYSWEWFDDHDEIYSVVSVSEYIGGAILQSHHEYIGVLINNTFDINKTTMSEVFELVEYFGLEGWFYQFSVVNATSDKLKVIMNNGWLLDDYEHVADKFLAHLTRGSQSAAEMLRLLQWSKEDVNELKLAIVGLKKNAATIAIQIARESARDITAQYIKYKSRDGLTTLLKRHGIKFSPAMNKVKLTELLLSSQSYCEDFIGLSKVIAARDASHSQS